MFRQMLYTQWKWSGPQTVLAGVVAFGLPILVVRTVGVSDPTWVDAREILAGMERWSNWFPILAMGVGLLVGTTAWSRDHRGGHVYALSLPLSRWHYVLLRYGAGLVLLAVPMFTLWIGASVASAVTTVPLGLHAYPHALGLRFAIATVVAFSLFFTISAGTTKTAGIVLGLVGTLVVAAIMLQMTGSQVDVVTPVFDRLITWPGPFEIFVGRWMLIDV